MKCTFNALLFLLASFSATAQIVSVEEAVEVALEKNFDVKVIRAISESAFNDNRFAYGAFLPQVNAAGSYTKSVNNSNNLAFPNATNPNPVEQPHSRIRITNPNAGAQLFWPIFDGTKMFATRQRIAELAH